MNKIFENVQDLLESYGGHALAGGFSVGSDKAEELKEKLELYLNKQLKDYTPPLVDVIEVTGNEISKVSVKQLELLEPLGNGNEEMRFFIKDLPVSKVTSLSNGKHIRFDLSLPQVKAQALFFNHGDLFEQLKDTKMINAVGKFNINVFNNIESVNLIIEDIK